MAGSGIAVSITADTGDLVKQMAIAKAELANYSADVRRVAKIVVEAGDTATQAQNAQLNALSMSVAKKKVELATLWDAYKVMGVRMADAVSLARMGGDTSKFSLGMQETVAQINEMNAANATAKARITAVSAAGEHQAGIFREKMVLAHEAATGSLKRMMASMMVLTERTGSFAGTLATLATPTTLAAMGFVALAAAVYKGYEAIEGFDRSVGGIKAAMDATGQGTDFSRAKIVGYMETLRAIPGVSTAAAEEMVSSFARQRDIGVGSYVALGEAAAGYARVTGMEVPKAAEKLTGALKGGYEGLAKLDREFPFLSIAQAQAIHDFEATGQKADEFRTAIEALHTKFGPLITDGLTPAQMAANDLGLAWDHLMGQLGRTGPIAQARDALTGLVRAASHTFDPAQVDRYGAALKELDAGRAIAAKHESDAAAIASEKVKLTQAEAQYEAAVTADQQKQSHESAVQLDAARENLRLTEARLAALRAPIAAPEPVKAESGGDGGAAKADSERLQRMREYQDALLVSKKDKEAIRSIDLAITQAQIDKNGASAAELPIIQGRLELLAKEKQQAVNRVGATELQDLRDQLDQMLVARRVYGEQAKSVKLTFWEQHKAGAQAGSREEIEINKQIFTLRNELNTKGLADQKKNLAEWWSDYNENIKLQIGADKGHFDQQIKLANEWVAAGKRIFGDNTKNYKAALDEQANLTKEKNAEQDAIAKASVSTDIAIAKMNFQAAKDGMDELVAQKKITAQQEIGFEIQNAQKMYELDLQELEDRKNTLGLSAKEYADYTNKIRVLATQHNLEMAKLSSDFVKAGAKDFATFKKDWEQAFAPIEHAFSSSIQGMLQGTETLKQGMAKAAQSIALSYIQSSATMGLKFVADRSAEFVWHKFFETAKTADTVAGNAARTAADASGSASFLGSLGTQLMQWLGLETAKTAETVTGSAARATSEAAAALETIASAKLIAAGALPPMIALASMEAAASVAMVPIIGPALATAAASDMTILGAGYLAMASAEGGWDRVPYDGALTELHKNEMVLPASIAGPLRQMTQAMPAQAVPAQLPRAMGDLGGSMALGMGMGMMQLSLPAGVASAMAGLSMNAGPVNAGPANTSAANGNSGSGNGAGGDTNHFHITIQALDTQTGAQFLMNNMKTIAQGLAKEVRNANPNAMRRA